MIDATYGLLAIGAMAAVTTALRVAPVLLLGRLRHHRLVVRIARFLPPAIMAILVVYVLKDTPLSAPTHGLPELGCALLVAAIHLWRGDALLSIALGTAAYVALVNGWIGPFG